MNDLGDRLETLRAKMEAEAATGLGSLSLAFRKSEPPLWRIEPIPGHTGEEDISLVLAKALQSRPWRRLARDVATANIRFLAAGPDHRLSIAPGRIVFEASAQSGDTWGHGSPLARLLQVSDLVPGQLTVLGGPTKGHARLAALTDIARWAEENGLSPPDGRRIDADWWIQPGAVLRQGPFVVVFVPPDPVRTHVKRLW